LFYKQDFYYYFLPLAASLPILVFTVFAFTEDLFLRDHKSQLLYGALLSCSLCYTILQHATHLSRNNDEGIKQTPEFQYLSRQNLQDYQLYVFDNANFVYAYNKFRILAPSPWIYHHFWQWYDGWDADHQILQSIEQHLLAHKTRFVLDCSDRHIHARNKPVYDLWKNFLRQYYTPVYTDSSSLVLWRIQ
jgi:hypothetical protein